MTITEVRKTWMLPADHRKRMSTKRGQWGRGSTT